MADTEKNMARRWLWVCRPEFYRRVYTDPWWTCDPTTRAGDWALLYCTSPVCSIGYLLRATTDARWYGHEQEARQHGWSWGCAYEVVYRFTAPLSLTAMKRSLRLQRWRALRLNFRGSFFPISRPEWDVIAELLVASNPDAAEVLARV